MNENLKDKDKQVILLADAKDGQIKAVTDVDKDGNVQTTDPTQENMSSLLQVNTNDSGLEAFFKKFMEQADNPSHTGIYILGADTLGKILESGANLIDEIGMYFTDPAEELHEMQQQKQNKQDEKQSFEPLDVKKIDLDDLEKKGIKMEDLEPFLKAMSYGHKSNQLIDMSPELEGGIRVPTKGRVSLEEMEDGSIRVTPHYRQDKPNLDIPIHGVLLDDKVKDNLLKTGHAGQLVDLETTPSKKEAHYVTLDPLTNKVEVLPADRINNIDKIKGVDLSQGQQMDLAAGRKILVEGMTSRAGRLFDGYIQINASDRKLDFNYDGLDRQRYAQENKEIAKQQRAEKKQEQQTVTGDGNLKNLRVPQKLKGVELTEQQQATLRSGKATYVKGMVNDGKGEPYNAWVKPNPEKNKFDFFKWNPDYVKKGQGTEIKPAAESKTQVAVNNDGKTNEATKNVKEPLKQGQQKPTEGQQQKQEEQQKKQIQPKKATVKKSGPKL